MTYCKALGTLLNVMWQPGWRGSLERNWIHAYRMAVSLCGSPETITVLLIGYLPIQNKKFKNNNK